MTTTWRGGPIGAGAQAVLAPNPGPMTLEGTNTWVLPTPDGAVVIDPGPDGSPQHLDAVLAVAGTVALTVLTHHHRDHTGAVPQWEEVTRAPVRGAGRGAPFTDGERLTVGDLEVLVLLTPGHTPDSVCLLVQDTRLLLTGDTVLGRGTSVVPWPEGDLGAYLDSLDRLIALAESGRVDRIAPGHGPVITEPLTFLTTLRDHRRQRLEQVRQALHDGARDAEDVVARVYGDTEAHLHGAALATVRAQLVHLGHAPD